MKKILVPTDFSDQAGYAMDVGCQLAAKAQSDLIVMHILDNTGLFDFYAGNSAYPLMGNPVGIDLDQQFLEMLYSNADEKMKTFVSKYAKKGVKITSNIKVGSAFFYMTEAIEEEEIDLVVMGSKGASGIEEVLIGSNTEKMVRHAKCPVFTVKSKTDIDTLKDIAFATSYREEELDVVQELKKLQQLLGARLHLVRINTPDHFETDRKTKSRAQEFVKNADITDYTINIYNDKVEEDGIIFFAQDINADMIAMATHGRTGILHLLSGSIAEEVVNHARRPVWTYRLK